MSGFLGFALLFCIAAADAPKERSTLKGHSAWVAAVAFSPDGRTLATASADHTVKMWDVAAGREKATLRGHADYVAAVAFSPDGTTLATGSYDRTVKLWELHERKDAVGPPREGATLQGHTGIVMTVAFSPNGKTLASGSLDGTIRLWEVGTKKEHATLRGHRSWVNCVTFAAKGALLASGSSDGTVKLWASPRRERATTTWRELATFPAGQRDGEVRSVNVSPDGKLLAAGTRYGAIKVWDISGVGGLDSAGAPKEPLTLKAHGGDVWSVAFSPDGKFLASGDGDWNKPGDVKLWDTTSWKERVTLKHTGEVLCVAYSPDGRTLAAGSWDKTVKLWDVSALRTR